MKVETGSFHKKNLLGVILKNNSDKNSALAKLMDIASCNSESLSKREIQQLVEDRENIATTLVSDNIAFPHAVKLGNKESIIVLGVSKKPILWSQSNQYVQVIVLFVGGNKEHLDSMATIAKLLRNPMVLREILKANDENILEKIIQKNVMTPTNLREIESKNENNDVLLNAARLLQKEIKNSSLAVIDDVFSSHQLSNRWYSNFDGYKLTSQKREIGDSNDNKPIVIGGSHIAFAENELKRLTLEGYFVDVDSLIILSGKPTSNIISSISIVNLINSEEIAFIEDIPYNVSQRALQLAREIGSEGREGKPVGCLFVLGSEETLKGYTHQLIVNPFRGYPEKERNIIDPSLEETIKEFSKIDGAFIFSREGTILSAGTYLAISPDTLKHNPGEGARHASARGITAVANCLAIAVSESTGRVSVYARGDRIL